MKEIENYLKSNIANGAYNSFIQLLFENKGSTFINLHRSTKKRKAVLPDAY